MNGKKVLLLAQETDRSSGSGRNAATMLSVLTAAGYEVTLLDFKKDFWAFVRTARKEAKRSDIVQAVDINPLGFAGFLATLFTRAKLVIICQAAYAVAPLYNFKTAIFSQIVYRSANAVVAGSVFVAQEIQKKVRGLTVHVIDPGIDMSKFTDPVRGPVSEREPFILSVGALKARKGYEVSLRAFALLKDRIPELRYIMVGSQTDEPRYFKMLTELARELGVEDRVDFLTDVSDAHLNELYEKASVFILTSVNLDFHFEGFGMVFLEAAAHGLPSIGTLGNGIADAVEDGKTGILVPQKDPEATAEALALILGDTERRARMSARAREFANEHDIPHLTKLYAQLYRGMLER
ncbi:glycosyltransferase family 1 protein [Patescibacteria group bacterium]|nr:MAG: glycosyltransferase family 1 protein [Patescibacteria group bacterium]